MIKMENYKQKFSGTGNWTRILCLQHWKLTFDFYNSIAVCSTNGYSYYALSVIDCLLHIRCVRPAMWMTWYTPRERMRPLKLIWTLFLTGFKTCAMFFRVAFEQFPEVDCLDIKLFMHIWIHCVEMCLMTLVPAVGGAFFIFPCFFNHRLCLSLG